MTGPRIIPQATYLALTDAAISFMDEIEAQAVAIYGREFMADLGEEGTVKCLFSLALQAIVTPESLHRQTIDIDAAAAGVGAGLGARCSAAGLVYGAMEQVLSRFRDGFVTGAMDAAQAASTMDTEGRA